MLWGAQWSLWMPNNPDTLLCLELDMRDIMEEHCQIEYEDEIMLIPEQGSCAVNNKLIKEPAKLRHGKKGMLLSSVHDVYEFVVVVV